MVTLSYASQIVAQCLSLLIFTSHWFACIIALQASLHSDARQTLAGAYGFCTDDQWESYRLGGRGASLPSCPGLSVGEWCVLPPSMHTTLPVCTPCGPPRRSSPLLIITGIVLHTPLSASRPCALPM